MFHCVLLHLLIVVVPCYPQVIFPTLMVLSATYCTCISLSYCPSSGCIPHYRESKVCHLFRVSEPFMYCGSPNLPQTRKSSLKLNDTGDNGHIADGAQLTKQMGKRLLLALSVVGDTT
jgi:hypothetical protein